MTKANMQKLKTKTENKQKNIKR